MAGPAGDGALGSSGSSGSGGFERADRARVSRSIRHAGSPHWPVSQLAARESWRAGHQKGTRRNRPSVTQESVQEVAHAGKDHSEAEAVSSGDDVWIFHRTA